MTDLPPPLSQQQRPSSVRYAYDQVLTPRASQEAVFNEVLPLVQSALDGYKACVFAFGEAGSGKTHTMLGPEGE